MREKMEKIARQAGSLLMDHFGKNVAVHAKGIKDLVTQADLDSEKFLIGELCETGLCRNVLSEECGGNAASDPLWIIDPLDGTLNFAMGNPLFGVNIALVSKGVPQAGCTFLPYFNELFYAERGKGTLMNGKRITCPPRPLDQSLVFCSWGHKAQAIRKGFRYEKKLLQAALNLRDPGCMALGLAYVACGRYGACVHNDVKPWDITPGCLMIEEAGGKVTDFDGNPWNPFMKSMVAANRQNHPELLQALR